MQNFRALGAPPPHPRASGGWGLCPQTPSLQRLGASPPDPHWPLAAGGSAPRPPKQPPHCEFLATRLRAHEPMAGLSQLLTDTLLLLWNYPGGESDFTQLEIIITKEIFAYYLLFSFISKDK